MVQGAGWRVGFIPDRLQNGLAPASFHAYLKQRMRWVGFDRVPSSTPILSDLAAVRRDHSCGESISNLSTRCIPTNVAYAACPSVFGIPDNVRQIRFGLAFCLRRPLTVCGMAFNDDGNVHNSRVSERTWLAPYVVLAIAHVIHLQQIPCHGASRCKESL